jgi:hypothetical protein
MKKINLITPYYASMTSVLKFFILYILSKWYGIFFAFPFIFLFFKIYQIIIFKRYNFSPLTINDYLLILKSFFHKNLTKGIKLKSNKKEEIIRLIKQFINENNSLQKILVYKYCNYYYKILTGEKLYKKTIIIIDENKKINLDKEISKKFDLTKEPSYKIFYEEKQEKIIIKYNHMAYESINLLEKYIDDTKDKKNKNIKSNKFMKLIFEFISFPFYLFLEIIIIFLLSIIYS